MAGDKGLSLEEIKNETVDLVRSSSDRDPVLLFLVFFLYLMIPVDCFDSKVSFGNSCRECLAAMI